MAEAAVAKQSSSTNASAWILGPVHDLLLFVGTPLLIVPLVWLAGRFWSVDEVCLFVLAFGSLGHHLPGMIRAYGDRELFAQYKTRFIVAPVAIVAFSMYSVVYQLQGLILVGVLWGVWHALMQTYGFVRIYDAKAKSIDALTARLDLFMCVVWFGAAITLSQDRTIMLLELFYASGGPLIPIWMIIAARLCWGFATLLVTLAFLGNLVRNWSKGVPPSAIKCCLMVSSFCFYWYANAVVGSLLLGLAMFEVFHDVQYLAIVWLFNRNRVKQGAPVGGFVRFIFQRNGTRIALYVSLVLLYGSLRLWEQGFLAPGQLRDSLTALLAASGILHFYYDGFIWKIRNTSTQRGLGVKSHDTRQSRPELRLADSAGLRHGLKWLGLAMPVAMLTIAQFQFLTTESERLESLVRLFPHNADLLCRLGSEHLESGRPKDAERQYRLAIRSDRNHVEANLNLGVVYRRDGRTRDAIQRFKRVIESNPNDAVAHEHLGSAYSDLEMLDRAEQHFRTAIEADSASFAAQHNLALVLARQQRVTEAIDQLRQLLGQFPNHSGAWYNLGKMLVADGRPAEAEEAYQRSLILQPDNVSARNNLATILAERGQTEAAVQQLRMLLNHAPGHTAARQNLERLLHHRTKLINTPDNSNQPAQ